MSGNISTESLCPTHCKMYSWIICKELNIYTENDALKVINKFPLGRKCLSTCLAICNLSILYFTMNTYLQSEQHANQVIEDSPLRDRRMSC